MGIPDRAALFSVRCTVDWIVAAGVVCRRLLPALVFRTSFRLLPELVPDNGKHSISHGPLLNMVYSRGIGICPMPFCLHYFIATLWMPQSAILRSVADSLRDETPFHVLMKPSIPFLPSYLDSLWTFILWLRFSIHLPAMRKLYRNVFLQKLLTA